MTAKAQAMLATGYAFSPIDLIPDFIPVIGLLDDLLILPVGVYCMRCLIPEAVMTDLSMESRVQLDRTRPVLWPAAAIFLPIWLGMGILLVRWLLG